MRFMDFFQLVQSSFNRVNRTLICIVFLRKLWFVTAWSATFTAVFQLFAIFMYDNFTAAKQAVVRVCIVYTVKRTETFICRVSSRHKKVRRETPI